MPRLLRITALVKSLLEGAHTRRRHGSPADVDGGPDGFHPSELSTFLAALAVYEGITGRDAQTLPPSALAAGAAHETVARFAATP